MPAPRAFTDMQKRDAFIVMNTGCHAAFAPCSHGI